MNLKDITLGAPAAERDIKREPSRAVDFSKGLMEYFVESDTYRSVERGITRILIGNRGSGKSAIFQVLAARERKRGSLVIEFAPDEYSYDILGKVLKKETSGHWGKQGAYAVAWKRVLYVAAMKEIAGRTSNIRSDSLRRIKQYLNDNYEGCQDGLRDQLISFLRRMEAVKLGDYNISVQTRELSQLYKLEGLTQLLPDLIDLCQSKPVVILVDELDRGWDGSEDARQFVAGLFSATISLNNLTPDFRVLISLRRELYDNIPEIYEDAQKVRDMLRYIEWDEAVLKDLIERRIASALKVPVDDDTWSLLFDASTPHGAGQSFRYILDRTLYRPRELIQFCTQCIEKAPGGSCRIDGAIIRAAEAMYSRDRAQDIAAEYRFEYPGLDDVFETFRGASHRLPRDDLELHCLRVVLDAEKRRGSKAAHWLIQKDYNDLIRILWRVGFLRGHVSRENTQHDNGDYVGPHQVATLNVETVRTFQIHEMFHAHYGIKPS